MKPLSRRAFVATLASSGAAAALGRTPFAGTLRLRLPLPFTGLDPHLADDPLSALFAPAIADPLFALDAIGRPYPALAAGLPEQSAGGARVTLRAELVSARGKALTAADVLFSLERARGLGGAAVLGAFASARRDPRDRHTIFVPGAEPGALARALASPLTALVARGFSPLDPDATGAFKASVAPDAITLLRNENGARAPAFLERIELRRARDVADALRAFEAGQADVGWLGNGLYRPKAGAVALEGPAFGWLVLRTGLDAKAWGAPGIAGQLAAGLYGADLARWGVTALSPSSEPVRWGGGPATLLVDADSAYALELSHALEPRLSSPGNEVRTVAVSRSALRDARRTRRFSLMLDFVRAANDDRGQAAQSILAAVDPALAKRPPKNSGSLRELTRTLPLGIIGELHVTGAASPEFVGLGVWQLGSVWVQPSRV